MFRSGFIKPEDLLSHVSSDWLMDNGKCTSNICLESPFPLMKLSIAKVLKSMRLNFTLMDFISLLGHF